MYSTLTPDRSNIDSAFDSLQAFIDVNYGRESIGAKVEALKLHCESIGLTTDDAQHIMDRAGEMFGELPYGLVFVGVIIGLRIADASLGKEADEEA